MAPMNTTAGLDGPPGTWQRFVDPFPEWDDGAALDEARS